MLNPNYKVRLYPWQPPGTLTPNQAGSRAGVTGEAVKGWIRNGKFPAARLPNGYYLIKETDFDKFVADRTDITKMDFKVHHRTSKKHA